MSKGERPRPVSAIMVLHDPLDWALEAQVVVDVLRGGAPDEFNQTCYAQSIGHVVGSAYTRMVTFAGYAQQSIHHAADIRIHVKIYW